MKRLAPLAAVFLTIAGACASVAGAAPAPHARARATHVVIFSDSFAGSKLDTSKWENGWFGDGVHPTNPVNGADASCYDPAQVNVGGGMLTITATKRSCLGYQWASGLINTNGHFSFTTGIFRAYVCLPPGPGVPTQDWPAIWTDGQKWPDDGEIDLLEGLNGKDEWHVHDAVHNPAPGGGSGGGGCHHIKYVRTASTVTFFYDGVKQGSASTSAFASSAHYLILELAVPSQWTPVAAQLHVRWVQVTT